MPSLVGSEMCIRDSKKILVEGIAPQLDSGLGLDKEVVFVVVVGIFDRAMQREGLVLVQPEVK